MFRKYFPSFGSELFSFAYNKPSKTNCSESIWCSLNHLFEVTLKKLFEYETKKQKKK